MKYAVYIIIFLSSTHLHADEMESEIIGTWLIKNDLPVIEYKTYHPAYRYVSPVRFITSGYGEHYSEDMLYGRYDVVIEVPQWNLKVIAFSGVWFFPKDSGEKLIFDLKQKDIDLYDFKLPFSVVNPVDSLSITRVLKLDSNEFIYEEYNPGNRCFDRFSAVKVPVQSLEQIKKLR